MTKTWILFENNKNHIDIILTWKLQIQQEQKNNYWNFKMLTENKIIIWILKWDSLIQNRLRIYLHYIIIIDNN